MKFFSRKEDSVVSQEQVLAELRKIQDPDLHRDVVTLGFIKNLKIEGGDITFDFVLTTPACPAKDQMRDDAVMLLSALPGVSHVNVNMQAEVKQQPSFSKTAIAGVKNVV